MPSGARRTATISRRSAWGTILRTLSPPASVASYEAEIAAGDTVLSLVPDADRREIVAIRRAPDGADVAARRSSGDLFDLADEDLFPADAELCVFEAAGALLSCSLQGSPAPPELATARGAPRSSLARRADDYLAVPWPLFLKGNFRLSPWTVLVAEPASIVYAPMHVFRTILPLVATLGVPLAEPPSVQQIRRRLVRSSGSRCDGALTGSDFGVRVEVEADDEFAELAAAFNAMASGSTPSSMRSSA